MTRDRKAMESRRFRAVSEVLSGKTQALVARRYSVTPGAVSQWMSTYRRGGASALKKTDATGRPSSLKTRDLQRIERALQKGPKAFGYGTDLWTLSRVRRVVKATTGLSFHQSHVWRLLRELGWSCQKPETRARERNETAIATWRKET